MYVHIKMSSIKFCSFVKNVLSYINYESIGLKYHNHN